MNEVSKRPLRVLISGAGIAGSTLAWFLAKAGARITFIEKSAALLPHGQNVDLQGSARTVIKKMGLTAEVRRFHTTEQGTQFLDPQGRPFALFPVKAGASTSFTSEFEILRGDLAALLFAATKDDPHVTSSFGTTIERVVSNDDAGVTVELSSGEVQTFDLVVAADGQWSKVRKQCFPPASVEVVDKGMYAVYWTVPRQPDDNDWWNVYQALGSRLITLRPDPHGTIRAMFTFMPRTDAQRAAWRDAARGDRETRAALLRREFADAGWQATRLLESIEQAPDFYFQAIQQIKMSAWSTARVVCVGDAAYAPTPLTGMGTSLAVIGAYVLAGELSRLQPGEHPSTALLAYERALRPFVEQVQAIPFFVPGIAHPEKAWQRALFRAFAWSLSKFAAIDWLASRFDYGDDEDFPLTAYPGFE